MINLSDTGPVAPVGNINVAWQEDASGNVSASVPLGGLVKRTVVSSGGVLTIDVTYANTFYIPLFENVTSMVLVDPEDGQEITLLWQQGTSTAYTVAFAVNLIGAIAVTSNLGQHTCQKFTFNIGDSNWYAIGGTNM